MATQRSFTTLTNVLLLLLLFVFSPSHAFYLPGVAPTDYKDGAKVPLNVNRLTPASSQKDQQLRSLISYDYYLPPFHFCKPKDGPKTVPESLGSILFGDRIMTSPFEIQMRKNETCKVLCYDQVYNWREASFVNGLIMQNYNFNWLIDGLPAATMYELDSHGNMFYSVGFQLGFALEENGHVYTALSNHYDILIDYHEVKTPGLGKGGKDAKYRVVGVEVIPRSYQSKAIREGENIRGDCSDESPMFLNDEPETTTKVTFTYSIYWRQSDTAWATRWDKYLHVFDPKIHWFSLVNSTIIVFFLVGMVGTILLRALRKDIARYNQLDLDEDVQEDSGWKLVHGDVFRSPKNPMLLSIFLGSGIQLFFMTGATIAFALLGFLSPSSRGSLGSAMVLLYAFFGIVGGYISARVYKFFGGENWKQNILYTPLLVPGIVFGTFILLNFLLISEQSSGAVSFGTMIALVAIWFTISIPLSTLGSWLGFRKDSIQPPLRTNQIPRQIPPSPMYLRPLPSMLLVGLLPFGAIFVELYFIMNSIWFNKVYYMFGFLFLCYGIMIITCATVTVLMVYFLLCSENYHWQWRAFCTAGASAIYIFLNAFLYWTTKLSLGGFTSNVLYLGYSLLISFLSFILTGTIGYFASWLFVHKIYSSIKID